MKQITQNFVEGESPTLTVKNMTLTTSTWGSQTR